jgi:hypothetical protein
MTEHLIGRGGVSWPSAERRSDRYGLVGLLGVFPIDVDSALWQGVEPGTSYPTGEYLPLPLSVARLAGRRGTLVATVVETRASGHCGDLFRGIYPSTPTVGERITLGTGTLFVDDGCVGVRPDDGRESDWLDPRALYRAHAQTVVLTFEEDVREDVMSKCEHDWQEQEGEPPFDACPKCGARRF